MNSEQLHRFSQILEDERERLMAQIASLNNGLETRMSESIGELSAYDNHPADIGDELFERSKDVALRDNAHVILENVEDALDKMIDGTYGICEKCGQPISLSRLEALPWAAECMRCQRADEEHGLPSRPLEEEVLNPPFERTFLDDDANEFVGFDGEDAWQAVQRYGSSDTPQDLPGTSDFDHLFFNPSETEGIVDPADAIPWDPAKTEAYPDRDEKKK